MSAFYREAFAVALGSLDHPLVSSHNPATFGEAAELLSALTPQQRCDAIYSDWLIQLHAPGGESQIQIRDLLLGQGAMDAHYLGELVQNADDAGATHLIITMADDWLLVANNGRPLNSLNLLGLCRFFVHSDGQVVGLTPETIGRFGIGFKACHRVAEQVLVSTWSENSDDSFGFRLPIANANTPSSHPDSEHLQRITERWRNLAQFKEPLRPVEQLGHCTPEYHASPSSILPASLQNQAAAFEQAHPNGTWFGMKLHPTGIQDALRHINDPDCAILGINPLFLRAIREIRFQNKVITKSIGNAAFRQAGSLCIRRITFGHATTTGVGQRSERMLLLEPAEKNGIWKMAIPVNSSWKLCSPEHGLPLSSSGKLHAFLPLSGLIWPHRCHIHLNLPPNLARSSWNADQGDNVKLAFADIAERLADWLLDGAEDWHPAWQPSLMLGSVQAQGAPNEAAMEFLEQFRRQMLQKELVRSIWGNRVSAEKAMELKLESGEQPKSAWFRMADRLHSHGQELLPIVPTIDAVDVLELDRMSSDDALALFDQISGLDLVKDQDFWNDYVWCAIGCIPQPKGVVSRAVYLERVLSKVPVSRINGNTTTMRDLAATEGRCRLQPNWHNLLSAVSDWIPQSDISNYNLYGRGIRQLFRNLAKPSETPATWTEVADAITEGATASLNGIWMQIMPPCPPNLRQQIVAGLHVFDTNGNFTPLVDTWVLSQIHPPLTRVLVQPLNGIMVRDRIQQWNLTEAYIEAVKLKFKDSFEKSISFRISNGMTDAVSAQLFVSPQDIPLQLREIATAILSKAFEEELRKITPDTKGKVVLVGNVPGSAVLRRLPTVVVAPEWLRETIVINFCSSLHLDAQMSIEFRIAGRILAAERDEFGKLLLDAYPHWKDVEVDVDDPDYSAMCNYFSNATGNWTVRLPGNVSRRLNEFFVFAEDMEPEDYQDLNALVIAGQNPCLSGVDLLPANLRKYSPLRNASIFPSRLSFGPLSQEQFDELLEIPVGLRGNHWFVELRKRLPEAKIVVHPEIPIIVYSYGNLKVSIENPEFTYYKHADFEWIVIFGSGERIPAEDGTKYTRILNLYSVLAPEDAQTERCLNSGRNFARFYQQNRDKIVNRLREVYATDLGYEAHHVLRELLQNAETSYATCSRTDPDGLRSFKVHLEPSQNGSEFAVSVVHHGRAFNESLPNGQEINDISRLCSVESNIPRVPGWAGRFNKGFKSLFQVTEGVKVISRSYSFELKDLILLDPAEPLPNPELADRPTSFVFTISLRTRRDFLSEGGKPARVGVFGVESLVFLQNIDCIEIAEGAKTLREFQIKRGTAPAPEGWQVTTITDPGGKEDESRFLTLSDTLGGKRYSVAIKLTDEQMPMQIESKKRRLFRTFPLDQPAEFAPFLIDADFSTDQGRRGLREFEHSGEIVISAVRSVIGLVKHVIDGEGTTEEAWLDWLAWLDLRSLGRAGDIFPSISIELRKDLKTFEEWLLKRIPVNGELRSIEDLVVASPLLFRLMRDPEYSSILKPDFGSGAWVSEKVAIMIRRDFERSEIETLPLATHVEKRIGEGANIDALRTALAKAHNRGFANNAFEKIELMQARWMIDPPVSHPLPPSQPVSSDGLVSLADILDAWDPDAAVQELTVAGHLGKLILPGSGGDAAIAEALKKADSIEGKAAWYRLLCLGCSFSTLLGTSPRERVIGLWTNRLGVDFWDKTIPNSIETAEREDFDRNLDSFFEKVIHRLFTNSNAGGEDAEFWRRVFYDFRKMHYFVFRNHLPETILEYTSFPQASGSGLIQFLKTGVVQEEFRDPSQPRFTGVIGQSMSSPLFFIMRELARLGVIDSRFGAACYYINRPSRRIASRLGWLSDEGFTVPKFDDLICFSEQVHCKFESEAPHLLGYYDLPLQWYALSNSR